MSASQKSSVSKKSQARTLRSSVRYRSANKGAFVAVRFRKPAPAWETNLERNLVEEGFTRAKARALVKLAAS